MCRTFRQDFLVYLRHVMTTLHESFHWSQPRSISLFTANEFNFLHLFLCANVCAFPRASVYTGQPTLTARTGPQGQEECVCLCKAHTCLLARACVLVCDFQYLHPPLQIISHMSSHETGNYDVCQRRCVTQGSPWTDCCGGTPAVITPEPIKDRLITYSTQWKWFSKKSEIKPVWLITLCRFDLFVCAWKIRSAQTLYLKFLSTWRRRKMFVWSCVFITWLN